MKACLLILSFLLGSSAALACGEETAYSRVAEEARSMGGAVKDFVKIEDGVYQGVVTGKIQQWNGKEVWVTFIVDVDRRCHVVLWRR